MKRVYFFRFFFSVFSVLVLGYTAIIGINSFFRYNEFEQEYKRKMIELTNLKKEYSTLNKQISSLNELPTWELLARERLNMIKPNETEFRFFYQEAM